MGKRPLQLFGQEQSQVTYPMARMNVIIHDMYGDIRIGDTLRKRGHQRGLSLPDAHPALPRQRPPVFYGPGVTYDALLPAGCLRHRQLQPEDVRTTFCVFWGGATRRPSKSIVMASVGRITRTANNPHSNCPQASPATAVRRAGTRIGPGNERILC